MASRRPAATECPPDCTRDSAPARDSRTSCLKISRSSSFASRSISAMRSCSTPALAAVDLPRSTRYAATSSVPRMLEAKGESENPPVVAPMVWSNSTKSRFAVPMRCMARHHSGTSGISSMGTACRSMRCSAYRISAVAMSCVSISVAPTAVTSVGMDLASLGMSETRSVGTHASASGLSGVSCSRLSSSVSATTFSISSGERPARYAAMRAFSSSSCALAMALSGLSSIVTWCVLSMSSFLMSGRNTSSSAMRFLSCASGSSKRRGITGSPSYSHALSERSISDKPRGNRPVLFSRMENSMVFTDESMAACVNPSFAIDAMVFSMSFSTLGMSSFATPLSPIANVGWRSSSSRPQPTMASPSPDSSSAMRSGAAGEPISRLSRNPTASAVSWSNGPSFKSQFTCTKDFCCSSPSPATYDATTRLGSAKNGCVATEESTSSRSNSLRNESRSSRRSSTSSSP
mmetsp:Transcript_445/g.1830  ORF Transcript_445/g.1830 Transcript_445/m.1830 type:complete len:462 (-) Transcript_445:766-2151(-)